MAMPAPTRPSQPAQESFGDWAATLYEKSQAEVEAKLAWILAWLRLREAAPAPAEMNAESSDELGLMLHTGLRLLCRFDEASWKTGCWSAVNPQHIVAAILRTFQRSYGSIPHRYRSGILRFILLDERLGEQEGMQDELFARIPVDHRGIRDHNVNFPDFQHGWIWSWRSTRRAFAAWALERYCDLLLEPPKPGREDNAYSHLFDSLLDRRWLCAGRGRTHHTFLASVPLAWYLRFLKNATTWLAIMQPTLRAHNLRDLIGSTWHQAVCKRLRPEAEQRFPGLATACVFPAMSSATFTVTTTSRTIRICHDRLGSVKIVQRECWWEIQRTNAVRSVRRIAATDLYSLLNEIARRFDHAFTPDLVRIDGIDPQLTCGLGAHGANWEPSAARQVLLRTAIAKAVSTAWRSLLPGFRTDVIPVIRGLYAARPWKTAPTLLADPRFWSNTFLLRDILSLRGARLAIAQITCQATFASCISTRLIDGVLDGTRSWMELVTCGHRQPTRVERRFLSQVPPGFRPCDLQIMRECSFPEPVWDPLQLRLCHAAFRRHPFNPITFRSILRTTKQEIIDALRIMAHHGFITADKPSQTAITAKTGRRKKPPRPSSPNPVSTELKGGDELLTIEDVQRIAINQTLRSPIRLMAAFGIIFDMREPMHGRLDTFTRASVRWHAEHRLGYDHPEEELSQSERQRLDASPFPEPDFGDIDCTIGGVVIRRLRTAADLQQEGKAMRHCVATYEQDARSGRSFLYHLQHVNGAATLELDPRGGVMQCRTYGNAADSLTSWAHWQIPKLVAQLQAK